MHLRGKTAIVTGGASGIGASIVRRIVAEHASAVVIVDRDAARAEALACECSGTSTAVITRPVDIGSAAAISALVGDIEAVCGEIDLICSNAGVMAGGDLEGSSEDAWMQAWNINLMAHVRMAKAALPKMIERGQGYFVNVASAAGVLTAPGEAAYTATKHAAVGFAEWLAITYGDRGIGVSVVCPGPVSTDMLANSLEHENEGVRRVAAASKVLDADDVARTIIEGVAANRFMIAPHEDTLWNVQRKWSDIDRWIGGMRRFLRTSA